MLFFSRTAPRVSGESHKLLSLSPNAPHISLNNYQLMRKVLSFSLFLMLGLVISQLLPGALGAGYASFKTCSDTLLYVCLGFIMINVGREFEIDKSRWRSYTADYFIAMATAALPWILIVLYYIFVLLPPPLWGSAAAWKENLLLSRFAAREQIVIGTTQQGSYKLGETTVCHSGLGKTFLGTVTGDSSRFAPLAEMFAGCGFPCEVCSQVQGMIWDKLMINASSSVLSGILQVAQGYVEQDSHAWTLAEKLIRELCAAATADGYPFDAEEQIARIRLHLQKAPDGFTSIYADLKAGRRTEVDVINGAVVEAGHRHNIPVPTHEFVVELVHAMEGRA